MKEMLMKVKRKIDDIYGFLDKYDHVPTSRESKLFLIASIIGDVELWYMLTLIQPQSGYMWIIFYLNVIVLLSAYRRVYILLKKQKQRINESEEEINQGVKHMITGTRCACLIGLIMCIGIIIETVVAFLLLISLRIRLAGWVGSLRRLY